MDGKKYSDLRTRTINCLKSCETTNICNCRLNQWIDFLVIGIAVEQSLRQLINKSKIMF
jgi:hypothetical protein